MSVTPALAFLLDTPNVWRGRALAGTPARVLGLAEHSHRAGAAVTQPPRTDASRSLDAQLVYDVHDDEAAVAFSLGEPPAKVRHYATLQRTALDMSDYIFVSTRNEGRLAERSQVDQARTAMLPNGADPRQHTCWGPDVDAATLVFVGNLYYEPNARAVEAIRTTTILPSLRAAGINARVRVIGRGPTELTRPADGMEFTGRVELDQRGSSWRDARPGTIDRWFRREDQGSRLHGRRTPVTRHQGSRHRTRDRPPRRRGRGRPDSLAFIARHVATRPNGATGNRYGRSPVRRAETVVATYRH